MRYGFFPKLAQRWLSPLLLAVLAGPLAHATTVEQQPLLADRQTLVKGNGAEPESLDPALVRSGFPGRRYWSICLKGWSAKMVRGISFLLRHSAGR